MTTETMIERVARAICEAQGDEWGREGPIGLMDAYRPAARAALQALRDGAADACRLAGVMEIQQFRAVLDAALQEKT